MIASDVSFNQMLRGATSNQKLGLSTSYMQVEHGIKELEGCWDGFVHTSDAYGLTFKSRKNIYQDFADALFDYLEAIGEPVSLEVGSKVCPDC